MGSKKNNFAFTRDRVGFKLLDIYIWWYFRQKAFCVGPKLWVKHTKFKLMMGKFIENIIEVILK